MVTAGTWKELLPPYLYCTALNQQCFLFTGVFLDCRGKRNVVQLSTKIISWCLSHFQNFKALHCSHILSFLAWWFSLHNYNANLYINNKHMHIGEKCMLPCLYWYNSMFRGAYYGNVLTYVCTITWILSFN